jgi:Pyruvate/2-oxoacid:ferredoxin oxidoreductase delta subunit
MEEKDKAALRENSQKENREKYDLEGNDSQVSFSRGIVESKGHLKKIRITVDLRYCKGCGICTVQCPTHALKMVKEEGKLKRAIQRVVAEKVPEGIMVAKEAGLPWQALPHRAGLVVVTGRESDNLTGAWRVGEVVIPDANYCVDCGVCSQACPEGIIDVEVDLDGDDVA